MVSVPRALAPRQPTNAAPLPRLFAYTQSLGLEPWLARRKRGLSPLVWSLLWLTLAWRGSGRPYHLRLLREPMLVALLGLRRLPSAESLRRSLAYFPAQALRRAVETRVPGRAAAAGGARVGRLGRPSVALLGPQPVGPSAQRLVRQP
jgi:hypothetical protein